ncbi:hypothetical protein BCT94_05440 [Vibrio breoganii]|uniref:Uncharacterized protein n=1 Tax=Vibrio breoganii TaxID=553239 RepID=A0AAP8N067_9VIBR|nr:hypothetical protein [Vibrio breoganii]PMK31635.1 hypothetical protein BCU03_07160 [Vibrio breoganii]PMK78531.1 hypothetical protein BCT94_05440 [Vibrio breoganii]PMP14063.1 hypothetical protein BCS93_04550 [Vibrio breoganii]
MNNPTKYNFPYRTNYEIWILIVWFIVGGISFVAPFFFGVPQTAYWTLSCVSLVIGLVVGVKGIEINIRKKRLQGRPLEFVNANDTRLLKQFGIEQEVINRVQENIKK